MAKGDNPFDPNDEGIYLPLAQRQAPQVPISGSNPFEPEGGTDRPAPATFSSNVADVLKPASNTFTVGMRDRLEGAYRTLTGEAPSYSAGVNQAVADSAMRRERSPYLSVAGDVLGGTAQAYVPGVGAVGRNLGLALGGAGRGAYPTAARMLGYGVEGGALGAAQAVGHTYTENPADYARNALIGGAFGGVLGAPFGKFADVAPRSLAEVPNSADLKISARQHYKDTHHSPMRYDDPLFQQGVDALEQHLQSPAVATNPVKSDKVWSVLDYMRNSQRYTPGMISPYELDAARQQLTGVNQPGARTARDFIDRFMLSPHAVVQGTPADQAAVGKSLSMARGDYRASKRTQSVEETNQYAGDRAAVANSGMNVGNTYGQRLTTKFLSPTSPEYKWSTPAEREEVRATTRRAPIYDALNKLSNMAGGGLGAGAGLYGGGGAMGAFATGDIKPFLAGLGIPALGYAAKTVGNRAMVRNAEELANTFAKNSPLYRSRVPYAPTVAGPGLGNFAEANRNAITVQMLNQLKQRGYMNTPDQEE